MIATDNTELLIQCLLTMHLLSFSSTSNMLRNGTC